MKKRRKSNQQPDDSGLTLAIIIGAGLFLCTGSFILSFIPVVVIPFLLSLNKKELETSGFITMTEEQLQKRIERIHQQSKSKITSRKPKSKKTQKIPIQIQIQQKEELKENKLISLLEVDKY